MSRVLALVSLLLALTVGSAATPALAQEGTPEGAGMPDLDFTFAEPPDFPAFEIVATEDGWEVPDEVEGGRLLASLENEAGIEFLDAQLMMIPEGVALDEVEQVFAEEPGEGEGAGPRWVYDALFPGGPIALAGSRGEAVVDLVPGEYAVLSTDPAAVEQLGVQPFTVVEGTDPADAEEPAADAEAEEIDFAFEVSEGLVAGPQVWKVTNNGDHPHMLVLQQSPEAITEEQVEAVLDLEATGGTPTADLPNPEEFLPVAYVPVLSTGVSTWVPLTLQEGYQVAACFVPDQTGDAHANLGMYAVFEVAA